MFRDLVPHLLIVLYITICQLILHCPLSEGQTIFRELVPHFSLSEGQTIFREMVPHCPLSEI
jgi:hypothetical protein